MKIMTKIKYYQHLFASLVLLTCTLPAWAITNLPQAYQQALISDPTFAQARAQYHASIESLPQAVAVLLPQISADGDYQGNALTNHKSTDLLTSGTHHYGSGSYGLSATQTLFDFAEFSTVAQANSQVKQALATFDAAQQDLMQRVAIAYFGVLQSQDNLRYDLAQKRYNYRQLDQSKQRYKVGVAAITDVYNSQAQYDSSVALIITDNNNIDNARENLRAITGQYYTDLAPLRERLPLISPKPKDVNTWVEVAERQNFTLQAARYAASAAKSFVNVERAGHLPTVTGVAGTDRMRNGFNGFQPQDQTVSSVGLTISLPIFEGGLVLSQTRQAISEYHVALGVESFADRQAINNTHQNYNDVVNGISQVKADRQAIRSGESSVKLNEESFKVGTRTIIDVLNSVTMLTQAQRLHAQDQYDYLLATIGLKFAAGTLSSADLNDINQWLVQSEAAAKKAASPIDDDKATTPMHLPKHAKTTTHANSYKKSV